MTPAQKQTLEQIKALAGGKKGVKFTISELAPNTDRTGHHLWNIIQSLLDKGFVGKTHQGVYITKRFL